MEIKIVYANELRVADQDLIIHIVSEDGLSEALGGSGRFSGEFIRVLNKAQKLNDFNAKFKDFLIAYPNGSGGPARAFVGLGKRSEITSRTFQCAGAFLAKRVSNLNLERVVLSLHKSAGMDPFQTIKPFTEGIAIGAYTFSKYFYEKKPFPMGKMSIVIPENMDKTRTEESILDASYNVNASNIARHLTNEASNHKTPVKFEGLVREFLNGYDLQITTLTETDLKSENLNLIRAVGQAGSDPSRMLIIEYRPEGAKFTLGIVGKAVTFDAGGLMIKDKDQMQFMREDVGGAAAVVGLMSVVEELDLNYNIVAAIPIAENLIDSKAYRPSDVVITRNEVSVEVNNTDAEGRLLLADSFLYLQDKYSPDMVVDVATLTGSIARALGPKISGYFTNDEEMSSLICKASETSLEKFWRMPLDYEYESMLHSDFADMKNEGGEPKAITAALFLHRFIRNDLSWLHLDVGSTVHEIPDSSLYDRYATGIPSITLIEMLRLINKRGN